MRRFLLECLVVICVAVAHARYVKTDIGERFVYQELRQEAGEIEAQLARCENVRWMASGTVTDLQLRLESISTELEKL